MNHLIALKLYAIKYNPESRKEKEPGDIISLIRANNIDIENEDFRSITLKYGTPELYREIGERT